MMPGTGAENSARLVSMASAGTSPGVESVARTVLPLFPAAKLLHFGEEGCLLPSLLEKDFVVASHPRRNARQSNVSPDDLDQVCPERHHPHGKVPAGGFPQQDQAAGQAIEPNDRHVRLAHGRRLHLQESVLGQLLGKRRQGRPSLAIERVGLGLQLPAFLLGPHGQRGLRILVRGSSRRWTANEKEHEGKNEPRRLTQKTDHEIASPTYRSEPVNLPVTGALWPVSVRTSVPPSNSPSSEPSPAVVMLTSTGCPCGECQTGPSASVCT